MILGINHITLAIKDIETSFEFYKGVLKFRPLCKWDKGAYFLANDLWFCLNVDEKRTPNPCYTHYAFSIADDDFDLMSQRIIDSGALIFKKNSSPGKSLYFLDPDGHKLEIHCGSWDARIAIKKMDFGDWKSVQWFT